MDQKTRLKEIYDAYVQDPAFDHMRSDEIFFVPGRGVLEPKVMLIGEAPGRTENAKQKPFVGQSGLKLLDILKLIGIDEEYVFFTNVVKYWPRTESRQTRTPTEQEIADSRKYLKSEIEIVNPLFVGLCGRTPIRAIFPNVASVRSQHGKLLLGKYIPLYHPAVLLYKESKRDEVFMGYRLLRTLIDAKESN